MQRRSRSWKTPSPCPKRIPTRSNLLVVVYAYAKQDIIRVISAWKANKRQGELYEKGRS